MRKGSSVEVFLVLVGAYVGGLLGMLMESMLSSASLAEQVRRLGISFLQPLSWHIGFLDVWLEIFAMVGGGAGGWLAIRYLRHWRSPTT